MIRRWSRLIPNVQSEMRPTRLLFSFLLMREKIRIRKKPSKITRNLRKSLLKIHLRSQSSLNFFQVAQLTIIWNRNRLISKTQFHINSFRFLSFAFPPRYHNYFKILENSCSIINKPLRFLPSLIKPHSYFFACLSPISPNNIAFKIPTPPMPLSTLIEFNLMLDILYHLNMEQIKFIYTINILINLTRIF